MKQWIIPDANPEDLGDTFLFITVCPPGSAIHSVEFGIPLSYIETTLAVRRAGRTAIAPVLKTGARKGLGVRIPRSPLECLHFLPTSCILLLMTEATPVRHVI